MRVSFRHQFDNYQNDLNRVQSRYFEAQNQVTTGKKINQVGDDPFGAATALNLRGLRSGLEQYRDNLSTAKGQLAITENTMGEMTRLVRRAYELSVAGANTSTSQESRQAMATEVASIQQRLVDLGNTQGPSGQYLFAGQNTSVKPFLQAGSTLTFTGDNNDIRAEVSPSDTLVVNIKAQKLFTDSFNRLESLKNNLNGGNLPALSGVDLPAMQSSEKEINLVRGDVGARLKTIEELSSQHLRRMDELTGQISDVEDVDMSEAILNYKQAETAYQAALQTVSSTSRLSLLDYLR
jgi:flagellar hook-associated protein 3 FlgL